MVLNLVVNARDAMPNGGTIKIAVGAAEHADLNIQWGSIKQAANVVMLSVSDEGAGIPPDVRAQLFQPYFTTKPEGKGTGLGLSTVYGIVQQSGGAIALESEPGRGTTFKIYLPAESAPVEPEPALAEHRAPARLECAEGGMILVAEDDPAIASVVRASLTRRGFNVLSAENADAALNLLSQHRGSVMLLLTDVMMPGKNGAALAEEASALQPGIKILFMSGYTADEAMHKTLERLGAGLIHKPFLPETLAQKISATLKN